MGRRQPLRVQSGGHALRLRGGRERQRPRTVSPPGGAVLAHDRNWRREARAAWYSGVALTGALTLIDLARGALDGFRGGCWVALGALLLAVLMPQRVTAGEGWLATRGLLRERRVRTDLLTQVRRSDGITPRLILRDAGGARVELDPAVLVDNPLLWHHLDTGARRARTVGLLREGATPLACVARRVDDEVARELLREAGLE
ncbi:hypothetical protein QZH56_25060 [Streptomyces olivoreticuli]|uniref:hypothetical protein n=1 Tax=Streptomyces olivoreticuli TaxID=68246 RepID=UPI00265A77BF|nr:hypothetical protein [Streptomyces olivoreticuli]WKK22060.1 hypothetical protein QZH56_25060 [Streptomyces olivoreticuli]